MELVVLGMPRSGTSLAATILEGMGYDFLCGQPTVDSKYPKSDGYRQRRDIHELVEPFSMFPKELKKLDNIERDWKNILSHTHTKENTACKEPYLLYVLPFLPQKKPIVVLCLRNVRDVYNSAINFQKECGQFVFFPVYFWFNYYYIFLKNIRSQYKYVVLDYDELIYDPENTYDNFWKELCDKTGKRIRKIQIESYIKTKSFFGATQSHPLEHHYKWCIKNNIEYKTHTYSPNEQCYCLSGDIFQNCHGS